MTPLLVRAEALGRDPALAPGGRGARKIVVPELRPGTEAIARSTDWMPPSTPEPCPVMVADGLELSVFNQCAAQTRHTHPAGPEVYIALDGSLSIEVEGRLQHLGPGDILVVPAGAAHGVLPSPSPFRCTAIKLNCTGPDNKVPAPNP